MKRTCTAVVLLLVFMAGFLAPPAAYAATGSSVTQVTVRPDIATVDEFTRYQISFVSNETLNGGIDTIHIRFPAEYSFSHGLWTEGYVEIKGMAAAGVSYSAGLLLAVIPRNTTITPGETVTINLHAGIMRNPNKSGDYSLSVNTSKETTPVASPIFTISEYVNPEGVSKAHVSTNPVGGYQNEEIVIRFTTNRNGQLIGGVDQIIIDFPTGFRIPQSIDESSIKINGIQMHSLPPAAAGAKLILPLSPTMNFPEYHHVEVVIGAGAGITIDRDILDARLYVSTTKNTTLVESFDFSVRKTPDQVYRPSDEQSPSVYVAPNGAGALGQWIFTFPRNTIILIEGESVMGFTIIFPNGTVLPGSIATQHISVNGQQSTGVLVNPSRRELIFTMPIGIPVYSEITITISASAGIQNPPTAVYLMEILPQRGTRTLTTKSFEIKTVSDPVQAAPGEPLGDKVVKVTLNDPVAVKDGLAVVLDAPPQLIDGITMVPLRFVSEGLGAGVVYNDAQNMITVTLGGRVVELWIDATIARVDGEVVTLAKAPIIRNDRTMVPVRFVSECFGAKVDYVSAIDPITITMTADALSHMPTVEQIKAAQTAATTGGATTTPTQDTGTGASGATETGGGDSGSGAAGAETPIVGRTITLGAGRTNANLRKGPGTNYDIVGLLLPTETAKVIEVSNDWYHIEFSYGMQAWIREDLVDFV